MAHKSIYHSKSHPTPVTFNYKAAHTLSLAVATDSLVDRIGLFTYIIDNH
jgi:hypothetical protein